MAALLSCGYEVNFTQPQTPPVAGNTATLSWVPPTENTDNTPLTDLAGFKIYYGTDTMSVIDIPNPGITEYVVTDIAPPGMYAFYLTAYNSIGIESAPSETVYKEITQ